MAPTSNADLKVLMQSIGSGDQAALAGLYRALERPVYKFILSKLNDPAEAHDILHEVFMDVWKAAPSFEGRSTVKTWIFGIAYRKTMDHFRKHSRVSVTDDMPEQIDESPDAASCLAASQESAHVKHCMGELKAEHRSAVELAFFEDMSYGQISEVAGVPEGTIKTRIYHAKKLLMRCLQGRIAGALS
ncbi:MAG: RNA polymerase sigma factor [Pseudomonadota bacterium]